MLPEPPRRAIGLAYLLARIADTLADSWGGPPWTREDLLIDFRAALRMAARGSDGRFALPPLPDHLPPAETRLLADSSAALELLAATPRHSRQLIGRVVRSLIGGMLFDLRRFRRGGLSGLDRWDELDLYTYQIAGVVGVFWTDLAILCGVWPREARDRLAWWGLRYGKGLQLVNVLRDVRNDLDRGRVYLPADDLAAAGLCSADLRRPEKNEPFQQVLGGYIRTAQEHLAYAHNYVCAIPRRHYRLRLASLWPLWLGLATLQRLQACPNLLEAPPVRIPQKTTNRLLALSLVCAPSNRLVTCVYRRLVKPLRRLP